MEIIVKYHPTVQEYFNGLIEALFYENYFLYKESAEEYITHLLWSVENKINWKKHHLAPPLIAQHGSFYASFYINNKTTWYFVFEKQDHRYLIT
ncbi:hypothetical protein G6M26_20860 [Agrobacterium tumefaciens]|nr:hypothetical protein [Agrobacterium tumefaciens]NTE20990.1 hypothetical protein [Agrobacterium tumefaciens]